MLGWRRRRAGRERGAIAVEAALVTPVILLLLFGVVEFGMYFKDSLAVSNAVRAGVRIASAEPRQSTFAADAAASVAREGSALSMAAVEELWVYRADKETGAPTTGSFDDCTECVKFTWDEATSSFTQNGGSWPATAHNACQGDSDRTHVGIYLRYRHPSSTNLIFNEISMGDYAVMSFEPIPEARGCKA